MKLIDKNRRALGTERLLPIILCLLYFITVTAISIPKYDIFKYIAIVLIGLFLLSRPGYFIRPKHYVLNTVLLIYSIIVLCTSFVHKDMVEQRPIFLSAIVYTTILIESFFMMEYTVEVNKIDMLISLYYKLTLICVIVNDVLAFASPGVFSDGYWLLGGKFNVTYAHIRLMALLMADGYIRHSGSKKVASLFIVYAVISVIMGIKVDCNTGTIGSCIFAIGYIMFKNRKSLCKPVIILAVLILSCLFVIAYEMILSNEYVQYFVTEVLGRSLTLTGRTNIYMKIPSVLEGHWLFGYGYGSAYEICMKYMNVADTQNGLLEWILQVGSIATAFIIAMIYISFKRLMYSEKIRFVMPIVILIYVFSILASVEITINMAYFFWIALIYGIGTMQESECGNNI